MVEVHYGVIRGNEDFRRSRIDVHLEDARTTTVTKRASMLFLESHPFTLPAKRVGKKLLAN